MPSQNIPPEMFKVKIIKHTGDRRMGGNQRGVFKNIWLLSLTIRNLKLSAGVGEQDFLKVQNIIQCKTTTGSLVYSCLASANQFPLLSPSAPSPEFQPITEGTGNRFSPLRNIRPTTLPNGLFNLST